MNTKNTEASLNKNIEKTIPFAVFIESSQKENFQDEGTYSVTMWGEGVQC